MDCSRINDLENGKKSFSNFAESLVFCVELQFTKQMGSAAVVVAEMLY